MSFLRQVDDINLRQRTRVVQIATTMLNGSVARSRIAVWGRPSNRRATTVRDSPPSRIAGQAPRGALVSVYDPKANDRLRARCSRPSTTPSPRLGPRRGRRPAAPP